MDAQQELFSRLLVDLRRYFKEQGYEVYDGALPPDGTPYPFVYLGDFRQDDDNTKTQIIGSVYPTIHVWHNNPRERGTVSSMLFAIKVILRNIKNTEHFSWMMKDVTQNIFPDTTTKTPLLHGVIEAELRFT